jgi:molybdenum cofactor cytidylyltransferase
MQIVVLVLASGRGERFKASLTSADIHTHKLDAPFFLGHIDKGLPAMTVLETTVYKARQTGLTVHIERSNHAGMGDAIAAAVTATQDADGWLILPADMPMVPPGVVLAVADGLKNRAKPAIVAPFFQGQRGHPVGFSKSCQSDLLDLRGDFGARALLIKFGVQKINVTDLPMAAGCLLDIDTPQDLESLQKNGIFQ